MKSVLFVMTVIFCIIRERLGVLISVADEINVPVFQPYPSLTIQTNNLCKGALSSFIKPFTISAKDYIAISLTTCGLYIYDITDFNNPTIALKDILNPIGKTLGVQYSETTQYLWIGHSSGQFFGINVAKFPFKVSVKGVSNNNLPVNRITLWPQNNNILFLLCLQQFQIFDFRDSLAGAQYLQGVTVNALNALQIEFVRQSTFALVTATNQGIQFYSVKDGTDIEAITFTYTCVLKPYFFDVNQFSFIDDNTIAIMMLYKGIYIYSIKDFLDNNGQSCTPTSFLQLAETPTQGQGGNMYISKNQRYLYAQFRSVGVRLYDVIDQSFQIIQNISVDSNCKDIILNDDETLLYYTNSLTLQIFKKTTPNFNRDKPNLLLNSYQIVEYTWFKESSVLGSLDYSCDLKEDKDELFIARANFGAAVFKYSGNGILEDLSYIYRTPSLYPTSIMAFLADGVTAYLCRSNLGLYITDFTNPAAPVKIKEGLTLKSPFVNFNYVKFNKSFTLGIICNYINGYIISIADPLNPFIIGVLDTMKQTLGETSLYKFIFTEDEKHIFMVVFTYGILVANISNPLAPVFISQLFTDGVYDITLTQDEQYAIIGASYTGILIAKVGADFSMTVVSQVQLIGSMFNIILMQNDEYILATTNENPSISLVSIVDKLQPIVIQRIGQSSAFGYYSMCLTKDTSMVFVTSQYSLLLLQLQNQIILHTQIYELISQQNSNEYTRNDLEKGVSLKIGQNIEMHLVSIYQTQDIIVRKAFYYEGYVLQDLPSWMLFSPSEQILRLDISKDSLQKSASGDYIETVQQVVFLTYQSLYDGAFVNTYLDITGTDSVAIKNACIKEGYVDNLGFIQETYTPTKQINFGVNEVIYLAKWLGPKLNLVKQFIQYTLNQNIVNYTTSFLISQSIQVNLQDAVKPIVSLQDDITIQLTVLEKLSDTTSVQSEKAKFVNKNYSGVLMLLSEKQDEIKIEGTLDNVNKILEEGVKFSINKELITPDKILIQITVIDGVNYNYENTVAYSELKLLSMQAPIVISDTLTLQNDINSKYTGGYIYIQDSFQYQVSAEVFTSLDETVLQYSAKIKDAGTYVDIPKDYWMQFSSTDRVFTGSPPASFYNDKIYVQVNATDGYSFTLGEFEVVPNKIPFNYAFQLAIQIFGPIFGILGFYKYKHIMYNILFRQQYIYSKDVAYVGETYRKQITITDNNREVALKLWKFFYNRIGDVQITHQLSTELMKPNQTTSFLFYSPEAKKLDEDNHYQSQDQQPTFEEEIIKKIYPFGVNTEQLGIVEKKFKKILVESSSKLDPLKVNSSINNENVSNSNTNNNKLNDNNNERKANKVNQKETPKNKEQNQNKTKGKNTLDCPSSTNVYRIDVLSQLQNKKGIKRRSTVKKVNAKKIIDNIKYGLNICDNISRLKHLEESVSESRKKIVKSIESLQIFQADGKINFKDILKYIREEQEKIPEQDRAASTLELKNLLNRTSVLSQAICCLFIDHLLNADRITKNLFDFMYQKAIKYYNEIDWYKAYVNIKPQFEDVHTNPYPQITINERTTHSALAEIFRSLSRYYYDPITKNPKPINFSLSLLEECLKARAIGVTLKSLPLLQVTQGESLHTFSHLIHSVKAFERNNDITCCFSIYKALDLNYIEKGLTDNEKLPSWIHSIDLINGSILLSGVPEKKDIGSIIIKVIDEQNFIIRSYQVQVLQKESQQEENKPILFSFHDMKQHDQHSNIVSALIGQNNTANPANPTNSNRKKKVSVFAPANQKEDFLCQSDANLISQNMGLSVSNQNLPITDRLNYTNNNWMQDTSIPITSPNGQVKQIDLNAEHNILIHDYKQYEMTAMNKSASSQNYSQDVYIDNQQNKLDISHSPAQKDSYQLQAEFHSSIQPNYQIENQVKQQDYNQNDEQINKEVIYDSFVPPSKLNQQPQDMPDQSDYTLSMTLYEEEKNNRADRQSWQNSEFKIQNKLKQDIILEDKQNQLNNSQMNESLDSKLRMFQYS